MPSPVNGDRNTAGAVLTLRHAVTSLRQIDTSSAVVADIFLGKRRHFLLIIRREKLSEDFCGSSDQPGLSLTTLNFQWTVVALVTSLEM